MSSKVFFLFAIVMAMVIALALIPAHPALALVNPDCKSGYSGLVRTDVIAHHYGHSELYYVPFRARFIDYTMGWDVTYDLSAGVLYSEFCSGDHVKIQILRVPIGLVLDPGYSTVFESWSKPPYTEYLTAQYTAYP